MRESAVWDVEESDVEVGDVEVGDVEVGNRVDMESGRRGRGRDQIQVQGIRDT